MIFYRCVHVLCVMCFASCVLRHAFCSCVLHLFCVMWFVSCVLRHVFCICFASCGLCRVLRHVFCVMCFASCFASCVLHHVNCVTCFASCALRHVLYVMCFASVFCVMCHAGWEHLEPALDRFAQVGALGGDSSSYIASWIAQLRNSQCTVYRVTRQHNVDSSQHNVDSPALNADCTGVYTHLCVCLCMRALLMPKNVSVYRSCCIAHKVHVCVCVCAFV